MSRLREFNEISMLFHAALDVPAAERLAFLEHACPDDSLRQEVRLLLERVEDVPSLLRTGGAARVAEAEHLPADVGGYHVLRLLGEGGMGVVFLAEQHTPLRRQVAIKLIKLGIATREVQARFDSERQALALMNHPNIAQVYDAGVTDGGRSYFVMEYVEGRRITDFAERHRLDLGQRLALFEQVCSAVQHAHQKAVIHRDIKPSNVLVALEDGRPVPKIIDFGIAKALDPRLQTGAQTVIGELLGTPGYMSPEQLDASARDVDTRTDVYSLGALLYELLVGVPPFDLDALRVADPQELRRVLREREPQRPSARLAAIAKSTIPVLQPEVVTVTARQLRGELDWIVGRAMEKDPDRRYGSPADLAADLTRFVRHEPIVAGPPSRLYRWRKALRRHRVAIGASAAALTLVVAFATHAVLERNRAQRAERLANQKKTEAEEVASHLVSVFASIMPWGPSVVGERRWVHEVREEIARELASDPHLEKRIQDALLRADMAFGSLQQVSDGLDQVTVTLLERDASLTLDLRAKLASWYTSSHQPEQAEPLLLAVLDAQRAELGEGDLETLRTQVLLGRCYIHARKLEEAHATLAGAVAGLTRALGPDHPETMLASRQLGVVHSLEGRWSEAEGIWRELSERRQRLGLPVDSATVYNQACALALLSRRDEALALLQRALDLGFFHEIQLPNGVLVWSLDAVRADPDFEALRDDPEFERVLADNARALLQDAGVRLHEGDVTGAKELLREVVRRGFLDHQSVAATVATLHDDPEIEAMVELVRSRSMSVPAPQPETE